MRQAIQVWNLHEIQAQSEGELPTAGATYGAHTEVNRSFMTVGTNHAHRVVGSLELTGSRAGGPPGSNPG